MEGSNKLSVDDLWNIVVFEKLEFFFSQHTVLVGGRQSLWFLYLLFIPSFPLFKTWVNQTYVFFGKLFFYGHKIKKASLNFIFPKNFLFPFFMFTMLNKSISNGQHKFECQVSSYKRDTKLIILCCVNKTQAKFLFTLHV